MKQTMPSECQNAWLESGNKLSPKFVLSLYPHHSLPGGSDSKESTCNSGDQIDPWVRKIPWRRECNPYQYSFLGNLMDRGALRATVHGVTKMSTQLSN